MFIEDLWDKNPGLVIKAVKKIFNVREDMGDSIKFVSTQDGALRFDKYGHHSYIIIVKDFEVYGCKPNSKINIDWMKFMHKACGEEYIQQYITSRNNKLDKFIYEYEKEYNNETLKVLAEMGVKKYQDMQNQIK